MATSGDELQKVDLAWRINDGDVVDDGGVGESIVVLGNNGELGLDQVGTSHEVNVDQGVGLQAGGGLGVVSPQNGHLGVGLPDRGAPRVSGVDKGGDRGSDGSEDSEGSGSLHVGYEFMRWKGRGRW